MHHPRAPAHPRPLLVFVEDFHVVELLIRLSAILHATIPAVPNLAALEANGSIKDWYPSHRLLYRESIKKDSTLDRFSIESA